MNDHLRILVADDSVVYRRILARAVQTAVGEAEILPAENGVQVLRLLAAGRVDACLLDIHMPVMDGLETLRHIREKYARLPVILISGSSRDSAQITVQALGLGALDFIRKPEGMDFDRNMAFISRHLAGLMGQILPGRPSAAAAGAPAQALPAGRWLPDVVLVASSTGGPAALEKVIPRLGADFPRPVLVVQHMPAGFTSMFAQSMDGKSPLAVSEARENDGVVSGRVLIAPGGLHMTVRETAGRRMIRLEKTEPVCGVRPSADVLFRSAAQAYAGRRVLAVVLTGMGRDGTDGVAALKRQTDCRCLTQSESSCVVYGMPRSVVEAGLSDETWDIDSMAARIIRLTEPAG